MEGYGGFELDLSGSGSYEYGNENSGSMIEGKFLDQLCDY
jgi:hypothetical protein